MTSYKNVVLGDECEKILKDLKEKTNKSVSKLVREAIMATYGPKKEEVEKK